MRADSRSILCRALVGAVVAFWVAGCATDRLDAAAPSGVNLTGEWKLNLNLSDDPDKLGPDPDSTPQRTPGSHRGHGGGRGGAGPGGGGMPPVGSPDGPGQDGPGNYESGPSTGGLVPHGLRGPSSAVGAVPSQDDTDLSGGTTAGALMPVALAGIDEATPLPAAGTVPNSKPSRGSSINRYLRAPQTMSITQNQGNITIKASLPDGTQTSDEYAAGSQSTIPYGKDDTAQRTAGWRGPVFVVSTSAKKAGTREDDFAMDDDGRLIMTTQTKGGRLGKVEIKRVYDRIHGSRS
jgi:hypothetical protein